MAVRSEYRRALSRARAARRERSSASSRISWRKCSSDGLPRVSMPMTRLRATRGRTTVSPPTAAAVASVVPMPELTDGRARRGPGCAWSVRRAAWWAAAAGADQTRAPGVGTGSGGAIFESNALRPSMRSSSSCRTYERYGLGGLVGDRVDGAPGGQGRDRHLGHEGERLVAVQGAGEQVGGLDEEAQRAAAQAFQLAEAGRLHRQGDAVGGELEAQGLFVGVAAG